jgi:two-component system, OmpR family, response regulator
MSADPTTILVVEDEPVTRHIVTRYLESAGFRVVAAESGEDALSRIRQEGSAIDWLLTDINLPGVIDGWVVGAEFHLNYPLRPVIYASAGGQRPAPCAGGVFVPKPYSPAMIAHLIGCLSAQDRTVDHRTPAERLQELLDSYSEAA